MCFEVDMDKRFRFRSFGDAIKEISLWHRGTKENATILHMYISNVTQCGAHLKFRGKGVDVGCIFRRLGYSRDPVNVSACNF